MLQVATVRQILEYCIKSGMLFYAVEIQVDTMICTRYDVECANRANYHLKKVCTINDTVKQNQMIWGNCTQQIRGFGVYAFFYPLFCLYGGVR